MAGWLNHETYLGRDLAGGLKGENIHAYVQTRSIHENIHWAHWGAFRVIVIDKTAYFGWGLGGALGGGLRGMLWKQTTRLVTTRSTVHLDDRTGRSSA